MPLPLSEACRIRQAAALCPFAIAARFAGGKVTSFSRVVTTDMPRAESMERSRMESASTMSFSSRCAARWAPVSAPPCAASSTMRNCGCTVAEERGGSAGCACAGSCWGEASSDRDAAPAQSTAKRQRARKVLARRYVSVQRIDGEAAQKLGIEVSRLLRHHLAVECDLAQLLQRGWVHQKCRLRRTLGHLLDSLSGVAQIAQVALLADGFLGKPQQLLQNQAVELRYIQLPLPLRKVRQRFLHRVRPSLQVVGAVGENSHERGGFGPRFG